jgi:hypothetical protein
MPRVLASAHGCDQSLADSAISWQPVSALIFADRSPGCRAAHAINRTMIVACTSETKLDLANQRTGVDRPAWVNRLIVRIVRTVSVLVRIIAVGIVPVIWIGIVKERVPKIVKEEESIVEVAMAESISAKATTVKPAAKAAAETSSTEAAAVKASSTEAAVTSATASPRSAATKPVRHHVRVCNSTNSKTNYRYNKLFAVHKN